MATSTNLKSGYRISKTRTDSEPQALQGAAGHKGMGSAISMQLSHMNGKSIDKLLREM